MNKIKRLGQCMGIFAINLAFIAPAHSNLASVRIPTSSNRTCQQSIDFVSRELASKGAFVPFNTHVVPGGRVEPRVSIKSIRNGNFYSTYRNPPSNRLELVEFQLSGNADRIWQGVLSSPQFLTTLASQIMVSCPRVGMVDYRHWFEGHIPVGYFSDGTARAFTWVQYNNPRVNEWGYYNSP